MANIKLTIEYDGTNYHGFQRQPGLKSIQETIENALFKVHGKKLEIDYAGRTDRGVHALGMVANYRVESTIDLGNLPRVIDRHLPDDIGIIKAEEVDRMFHARFSAKSKVYKYVILNRRYRSPIYRNRVAHVPFSIDENKMEESLRVLLGEHDFKSFMGRHAVVNHSIRTIDRIEVVRNGDFIEVEFEAKSFLKNMIRIVMGTAIAIGIGRFKIEEMGRILKDRNRCSAGPTAPACGLYLVEVKY